MRFGRFVWVTIVGALLALPLAAYAQDATLNGSVRDNTGGVLPGVTVTATHEAAGTTFVVSPTSEGCIGCPSAPACIGSRRSCRDSRPCCGPGVELLLGRQVTLNLDWPCRACRKR